MLRSFFLISILFASVMTTKGQIAQWLIQPEYDNIGFADNEDIIITELNGVKQLWDFNGHQLSATGIRDIIHPFAEGMLWSQPLTVKQSLGSTTPMEHSLPSTTWWHMLPHGSTMATS